MKIEKMIDHTILKPDTSKKQVVNLCKEAKFYKFAAVCVNPCHVELVAKELQGSDVKTCCVIGFPLGACTTETKAFETEDAIKKGAQEVDMVINIGALKDKDYDFVYEDIKAVVTASKGKALVKVIIETCLLSNEEKIKVCELIVKAGADVVKTSTGFSTGGATVEDIELIKKAVDGNVLIKASGGIRTKEDVQKLIKAGANRLGTSRGVTFIK